MIFIKVRNFRGCASADIEVNPVALLAGPNAAGKSSVAQAVGATLCGQANAGLISGRDSPGMLVRTGASDATVEITGDNGRVAMSWPSGRAQTEGERPASSSVYAAGLSSLVNLTPRERSRVLAEYLKADPTLDDLIAACREEGWDEATATMVWERVQQHTWDGFYKARQERGAELKGEWRGITSQVYGSRVAAGWRPDLEGLDIFELEAAAARARQLVENAVAAAAVSQGERDRLVGEAAALDERREALRLADAAIEECGNRLREAQLARQALPPAERQEAVPCPHCRQLVTVTPGDLGGRYTLEKVPEAILNDAEVKKRRLAIAGADGTIGNAQDAVNRARRSQMQAAAAVEESEKAAARLRDWPRAVETGTDHEAAREAARTAESQLADFKKKQEADKRHREIDNNEKLLAILAPTGLRSKKLSRVIEVFFGEAGLRGLTDAAGWEPVTVDDDATTFRLGGRPYALLSTSEQYRVRAILAIGMAKLDGSDLVVLDAADVLDARTRSGLMAVLDEAGIPALVGMTLSRPEQIPEPAREISYWIANGVVEPIVARAEAA